jgi:hypothetical protein
MNIWLSKLISDRHGGRVVKVDEQTVVLYDCGLWTDAHSRAVNERYPECDITIMQSHTSLSGFIVVLRVIDSSILKWNTLLITLLGLTVYGFLLIYLKE